MSDTLKIYIAGMGMITPAGANVAMTSATVKAGICRYAESEYDGQIGLMNRRLLQKHLDQ
jgi:hypothetical protein